MWGKDYSYPFVSVKDPMPADCLINEEFQFDNNNEYSEMEATATPPAHGTANSMSASVSISSSCTERGIRARQWRKYYTTSINGSYFKDGRTYYQLRIEDSQKHEAKVIIQNGDGSNEQKQKWTKTIKGEISYMKKMIATLRKMIEHQRLQLENMMAKDGNEDGSNGNHSNSNESDE